jgi:hypothetical protein
MENKNQGVLLGIGNSAIFSSFIIVGTLVFGIILGIIGEKLVRKRNEYESV